MNDLYLKVANDIQEDFLICYVHTDGLCYGLKYSPASAFGKAKLCVVELNSRHTCITTEQSNGAEMLDLPIEKDNVIHIYKDESAIGKFYVSYINGTGKEESETFVLEYRNGKVPVLEEEAFEFVNITVNSDNVNLGSKTNFLTSINADEYNSKLAQETTSKTNEKTTSETSANISETAEQPASEENSANTQESGIAVVSTTTSNNNSSFNGVPFIIGGMALALIIAGVFFVKKSNIINLNKKETTTGKNRGYSKDKCDEICDIINQSNIKNNKRLLAHSLIKKEDSERNLDIQLAKPDGYIYYRDQQATKIKYQKPGSNSTYIDDPFIIAMSDSWNLVIAQHNHAKSITLDIFNENYISKMQMDFEDLCIFLENYIDRYEYDRSFPAVSFLRALNILCTYYNNSDYAADSWISVFRKNLKNHSPKWEEIFRTKLPAEVFNAIIIIAELYIMKGTSAKNNDKSSKWEELIKLLMKINSDVDLKIHETENPLGSDEPILDPHLLKSKTGNNPPQGSNSRDNGKIIEVPKGNPETKSSGSETSPAELLYKHTNDYLKTFPSHGYCRLAMNVVTYHIISPYEITHFKDTRKKTIPEFLLLGNNRIYPNPYRFRDGIIRIEDITSISLDAVFEFNYLSTGEIIEILPAIIDENTMTVSQKGRIVLVN